MSGKKLRVGVFGLGMGANLLTLNRDSSSPLEVTAICTRDADKLRHFQSEYGIPKGSTDYENLLADNAIDIIAVYTPDMLHRDHCVMALESDKHVICTKPMATNLEDAEAILRAVKKSGKHFMVAQTARFTPQYRHMKSLLESTHPLKIHACRAQYIHDISPYLKLTPWRLEMPQDFMYGGGLHPIDLLYWYAGEIEEVFAYADRSQREPDYPMEDNFILLLKFRSGSMGTVSILCGVYHPPVPIIQVDVFHDRGSLSATYTEGMPGYLKSVSDALDSAPVQEIVYPAETGVTYKHGESERKICNYFADCIVKDIHPEPSVNDSTHCVAICDAAWESVRTGKPVSVKKVPT